MGAIQSIPETGLAIVNVGKRDISYDMELPLPELSFRSSIDIAPQALNEDFEVNELNDQHAYVKIPEQNSINNHFFLFNLRMEEVNREFL